MSTLRNKVQLIGHLGKDVEVKHLNNGKIVASVSLATSETYKDSSGKKVTDTQWHNLVAWDKTAEYLEQYTHKGSEVGITGKLVNRSYEDKNGVKKYISEVVVHEVMTFNAHKESESSGNKSSK